MRTFAIVATALVVVVAAGPAAALAGATPPGAPAPDATPATSGDRTVAVDDNESNGTPGDRVSGVVGVQDDRVRAAVDVGAYDARLAAADSPRERAAVVAEQLDATERRLDAIERGRDELVRAREAGDLSTGEFRAGAARLAERTRSVQRILDRSETAVAALPDGVREERALDERLAGQRERSEAVLADGVATAAAAFEDVDADAAAPVDASRVERAVAAGLEALPPALALLFGEERITLHVRQADGSVGLYHVRTSDREVVGAGAGPARDPTLHVYTTHEVVRGVADAEDPGRTVDRALSDDRITLRGTGFLGTLKYWTASALYDVYDGVRTLVGGLADLVGG